MCLLGTVVNVVNICCWQKLFTAVIFCGHFMNLILCGGSGLLNMDLEHGWDAMVKIHSRFLCCLSSCLVS